jgi:glucose/arabinose dehydrogenase
MARKTTLATSSRISPGTLPISRHFEREHVFARLVERHAGIPAVIQKGSAMKTAPWCVRLAAVALAVIAAPAYAQIQLVPAVSSGISNPTFVGHAGDGSGRLFIEEQAGVIRVLQPGSSTTTVFLDIRSKVLSGGERGLLGLAFHPMYSVNGRFFVYYTRVGDGAIVIAEYGVSSSDRNVANPSERILLTIPHPVNQNHNGGMIAFGPDGFLYIGVGDGGAANDPPNNAQNVNVLLGKILRIDISPRGLDPPYLSSPTNPFYGATAGRDEIFAFGMRNPWRFAFDPITQQLWVGDVGQGAREEVDTPIVSGGNYGWRVYEGAACTNNDPGLCNPSNYIPPLFEYAHSNGRCSITSGQVYRGRANTFRWGDYVYGDYCSGEIFVWDGANQRVVLDTTLGISSFGEDEQGEIYVVDLGGSVSRIVSPQSCAYSPAPLSQSFAADGGSASIDVTVANGCVSPPTETTSSWIHVNSVTGSDGATGARYRIAYSVDANPSPAPRVGTISIAGATFTVSQDGAVRRTRPRPPTDRPPEGRAQPRD